MNPSVKAPQKRPKHNIRLPKTLLSKNIRSKPLIPQPLPPLPNRILINLHTLNLTTPLPCNPHTHLLHALAYLSSSANKHLASLVEEINNVRAVVI